jgi:protein MpaA
MKRRLGTCALALVAALGVGVNNTDAAGHGADPVGRRTVVLGRSVDGRAIPAIETGDFDSSRRAFVVGSIHGNECAGIAVAARLARTQPPREVDLWILPNLNPDGATTDNRGNAHGVDLNRDFPYHWQRLAGIYYSGPRPLSEPESRIAFRLISGLHPAVSIWFHQHMDLVDESGGSVAIERRFAALVGLRLERLRQAPGSVVGWENHRFRSGTAFVVELPAGALSRTAIARFAKAVVAVTSDRSLAGTTYVRSKVKLGRDAYASGSGGSVDESREKANWAVSDLRVQMTRKRLR